jgi:hypothetical protein
MRIDMAAAPAIVLDMTVSADELKYMDRAVVTWTYWAWEHSDRLGYPEAGNIWGLFKPEARRFELALDDSKCAQIDRQIARRPWRKRKMIFVEYWLHEPQEQKARRFQLPRTTYRDRLDDLLRDLYKDMMPGIEDWRQSTL